MMLDLGTTFRKRLSKLLCLLMMVGVSVGGLSVISPATSATSSVTVRSAGLLLPTPYKMEYQYTLDIDNDGDQDVIIVGVDGIVPLAEGAENPDEGDGNRVLLVAQKVKQGYRRIGLGRSAVRCRRCGGAFFGVLVASVDVETTRNGFVVTQESGSRELTQWIHRYRYERGKIRLTGLDRAVTDRANGSTQSESTNYLTGEKIVTVDPNFEDQSIKSGRTKGKPKFIALESVRLE
jgi:hypothetical protein